MGMFDYVRSERELPDGYTGELQSKDFDCAMTIILIRDDGRLLIEDSDWEPVPDDELPYPDMPFIGCMRTVNRRWRDLDFHGIFNFYGGYHTGEWREYNAKFTDGQLVEIVQISPTPEPSHG